MKPVYLIPLRYKGPTVFSFRFPYLVTFITIPLMIESSDTFVLIMVSHLNSNEAYISYYL